MTLEFIVKSRGIDHEDDRRALLTAFNGDKNLGDFAARQVKFARMKIDATLGGHYHPDYREVFYMLEGSAEFTLEDIETKERDIIVLREGDMIMIPPMMAHMALVNAGSILVGCTEKPYISPEVNDARYEFS